MKAFMLSLAMLVVISGAAAVGLRYLPTSSSEVFSDRGTVRLDKRS